MSTRLDYVPSPVEKVVLCALHREGSISAAAAALHLSPNTVDRHPDNLRDRTGLRQMHQILTWASERGYLSGGG